MIENFSNLEKETDIQIQKADRVLNKINLNRSSPRHILTKMPRVKDKDRMLNTAREKQLTKESSEDYKQIFQQKHFRSEGSDMIYSKHRKEKISRQE